MFQYMLNKDNKYCFDVRFNTQKYCELLKAINTDDRNVKFIWILVLTNGNFEVYSRTRPYQTLNLADSLDATKLIKYEQNERWRDRDHLYICASIPDMLRLLAKPNVLDRPTINDVGLIRYKVQIGSARTQITIWTARSFRSSQKSAECCGRFFCIFDYFEKWLFQTSRISVKPELLGILQVKSWDRSVPEPRMKYRLK